MRIIIMAGGTAKSFNRHSITIQGEKLVDRTVRLLKENGQNDIWVTVAQKGMYPQYNAVSYTHLTLPTIYSV